MKKAKIVFLIFVLAIGIGTFIHVFQKTPVRNVTPISDINKQSVGVPIKLTIPRLKISAPIEQVGLDQKKRMDVPKGVGNVGWYNLGVRPGELGSAVIDGHYDTPTGAPSVFYKIATLQKGDIIIVTDNTKHQHNFFVTSNSVYPYDNLPLQKIFTQADATRLNLITCSGTWDRQDMNYSSRDVVYAIQSNN